MKIPTNTDISNKEGFKKPPYFCYTKYGNNYTVSKSVRL